MAMLVSVLFFAFEASNPDFPGNAVLRNAVQLALFLLIFIYLIAVMTYRDSRKELGGRLYYRDPVTYVFTGETVSITGTGLSSSITWKNIARIRETRSLFLLYVGPKGAVIVPKRFFQSPDEMERWRQLVAAWVKPKLIEKPSFVGRWN
jgi:hypothetical protein